MLRAALDLWAKNRLSGGYEEIQTRAGGKLFTGSRLMGGRENKSFNALTEAGGWVKVADVQVPVMGAR